MFVQDFLMTSPVCLHNSAFKNTLNVSLIACCLKRIEQPGFQQIFIMAMLKKRGKKDSCKCSFK